MEVRDRRLARLVVRRPGHAPVRPGRHSLRRRATGYRRPEGPAGQAGQLVDPGRVPDWLGPWWRVLRSDRRPAGPEPGPHAHHPNLRDVHRPVVPGPDVVAA